MKIRAKTTFVGTFNMKKDEIKECDDRRVVNDLKKLGLVEDESEEKELILSHFFFHASQKELAKRFGVTQSAISRRIKSILCKLRNEIGG